MFILILPKFFFVDTFLRFHRLEINTIYITDIIKGADTNMLSVAQKKENNSALAGGSAWEHHHICVPLITHRPETLFLLTQPDSSIRDYQPGKGNCDDRGIEGTLSNSEQAHLLVAKPLLERLLL